MRTPLTDLLAATKGSMIVSCQALPGEPLYDKERSIMPYMALAAKEAGCRCIRTSSVRDVLAIKEMTGLPCIGLIKRVYEGYDGYITPTMREVDELAEAGADVIALDCTLRTRGDGSTVADFLEDIRRKYPDIPLMADISTLEEGIHAWQCGVDLVGTTLSGYTPYSPQLDGPDYDLVTGLVNTLPIPVIAEGRIHFPDQAVRMLGLGAHAVVVGGAITRPLEIARRFFGAIRSAREDGGVAGRIL